MPKPLRDQLQKIDPNSSSAGGNLERTLERVEIIVGAGCGGESDEAFATRGRPAELLQAAVGSGGGVVDRSKLARERLDAMRASGNQQTNGKKLPEVSCFLSRARALSLFPLLLTLASLVD